MDFTFSSLPASIPGGESSVSVRTCGEYGHSSEDIDFVRIDGVSLGSLSPSRDCSARTVTTESRR
jgi:hypothetical protein